MSGAKELSESQPPRDEAVDELLAPPESGPDAPPAQEPDVTRVGTVETEDEPEGLEVTELNSAEREQFKSLLTVGRRIKKILVLDRPVVISSLMTDDIVRIGEKTKAHRDSQSFSQVYQAATVAAAIKSLEGKSWENTLEADPDPDVLFDMKYERVLQLYPLVVQFIYNEVVQMDVEFSELATKLGKLKG